MWSIARLLTLATLVPSLAVSAAIAPPHVHESEGPDHHTAVAHRHFAPHQHEAEDADHHDHDAAELSDHDEDVLWLDEAGIAETTRSFAPPLIVVSTRIGIAPQMVRHAVAAIDEATLPHGPPRCSLGLRAPPSVFL